MAPALDAILASSLQPRDGEPADGAAASPAPSLSLISIVLLAVGAAALLLSLIIVTVYFVRRRKASNRRDAFKSTVGQPVLVHAPKHAHAATDLTGMTPAMRFAFISRNASDQADHVLKQRAAAATVAAGQTMPASMQARMHNGNASSPRSSGEHSRPSTSSVVRPPLPEDSQMRILLAHQKSYGPGGSPTKSVRIVEPERRKQAPEPVATLPPSILLTSQNMQQQQQQLHRLPQLAPLQPIHHPASSAASGPYQVQRSLSPYPAPSDNGSESFTPVLDLGAEFGSLDVNDGQAGEGMIPDELDPHSWLASALDSAFNGESVQRAQSFSKPPRQAPRAPPMPSSETATQRKIVAAKANRSPIPPPPPIGGPPQNFVNPTMGGPSRVTVNYHSPYRRRTLHDDENGNDSIELVHDANPYQRQPRQQASRRTSIESAVRTAALFSAMEPALRASIDVAERPVLVRNEGSAAADLSMSSFEVQSQGMFSTSIGDNTTIRTSVEDESRDGASSELSKEIPIAAVAEISPIISNANTVTYSGFNIASTLPTEGILPTIQVPTEDERGLAPIVHSIEMQRQENLSNITLVNEEDRPKLQQQSIPKSGFTSGLRAKLALSRSKSGTSGVSGGIASADSSPVWSQKSPTFDAAAAFLLQDVATARSPALSCATKESAMTPGSFGPPTMTWNVSTEEVDVPHLFVQPSPNPATPLMKPTAKEVKSEIVGPTSVGLGLRDASERVMSDDAAVVASGSLPSLKSLSGNSSAAHNTVERKRSLERKKSLDRKKSLERKRSNSSRTPGRQSQDRYRNFPWSRTSGPPSSSIHGNAFNDAEERASSPQFADADSLLGSPVQAPAAANTFSTRRTSASGFDDAQWPLTRSASLRRDSMASSYCETICSSVNGSTTGGLGEGTFDYENAQSNRARLLQSVQRRQHAKQGRNDNESYRPTQQGFTSHSASLSIDIGAGPALLGRSNSKRGAYTESDSSRRPKPTPAVSLDVQVGAPFLARGLGEGVLTPPHTPFESKIALPDVDEKAILSIDPALRSTEADSRRISQLLSPTEEEKRDERLAKLRPLSLATNHANASAGHSPRVPAPLHLAHRSQHAASRTSSAFGSMGAITASSSHSSVAASNSSGHTMSAHAHATHSPTRATAMLYNANVHSSKRMSRASTTSGAGGGLGLGYGPMGSVNSSALSIGAGVLPTLSTGSNPSFLPSPNLAAPRSPAMTQPQRQSTMKQWLSAASVTSQTHGADPLREGHSLLSSPAAAAASRLSGSSFASHSSILAKFPTSVMNPMHAVQ